jgi:hypothetical protein
MNENEFELKLDFQRNTRDPARVFYSMGNYIDSFNAIDSSLVSMFCARIDAHLVLQDIQSGSIRTLIRRVLESVDDSALQEGNWKQVVGKFLHSAKHSVLRWCEDREEISDPQEVITKATEISRLAADTRLQAIPAYADFTPQALVGGISAIHKAGRVLQASDTLYYTSAGETIRVNRHIQFSEEIVHEFLEPRRDVRRQSCVLVVKKPDYLGNSRWDFKLEGHPIQAHIRDEDWLTAFRNRQFDLKPGDALKVTLEIQRDLDGENVETGVEYEVSEVRGIVAVQERHQQELPEIRKH